MQFSTTAPRTLLIAGCLLVAGMAVAGATTYLCGKELAAHRVDTSLDDGRLQRQQVLGQRFQRLQLMSGLMAGDTTFVSYVLEASSSGNDPFAGSQGGSTSVKDLLEERRERIGFDFGMVLDTNGGVVAATSGTSQEDLSTDLEFVASIKTHGTQPNYWLRNGQLYQVMVTHLANHDQQVGYLVLALVMNQVQLDLIKHGSGSEHLVFDTVDGDYKPVVGTLPADAMIALGKQLLKQNALPQKHFNLAFAGENWLVYADPLGSEGDSGVVLTLISYDQAMADVYTILKLMLVEILLAILFTAGGYVWLKKRPVASPAWPTRPQR
ncbi:MAG TPA: hypothetical protein VGH91_01460 [Gammaproteobacteria bacterium]|jgi:hypothetical protein